MEEAFYVDRLRSHGLEVIVPEVADRAEVHRVIYDELCHDVVLPVIDSTEAHVAAGVDFLLA